VIELESRVSQLQEELASGVGRSTTQTPSTDVLPRAPPRHELAGHRSPVTCVCFHPAFPVLASASEDCSIKLWDFESGEFERTLKGHTKSITHITFDEKGNVLGTAPYFKHFSSGDECSFPFA
jgi:platelet-activating factor acetylhydrolase IB subunit alpha